MSDHLFPAFPASTILGYPRIGPRRELKRALESFWSGATSEAELATTGAALRERTRTHLTACGLDPQSGAIPSDFSYYDQVLSTAVSVGAIPQRFGISTTTGPISLTDYSRLARGDSQTPPLELTKWFDTNYHYLVPEIGPDTPLHHVPGSSIVAEFTEAKEAGVLTRPVVVGPVTLLALAKGTDGISPLDRLDELVAVYQLLLAELAAAGAAWVQVDEPALVSDNGAVPAEQLTAAADRAYRVLAEGTDRPALLVAAPYGDLRERFAVLAGTGVEAIALDLVKGEIPDDGALVHARGLTLVAGLVDGHNVWRTDLDAATERLERLRSAHDGPVSVGTSTSLLHVPHTVADETSLPDRLRSWLAFADEKVAEVLALVAGPEAARGAFDVSRAAVHDRAGAPGVRREKVRQRTGALTSADIERDDAATRAAAQQARLGLPTLPTTTIGSFPQTSELRRARAQRRKGEVTEDQYQATIRGEIERVIELQTELGLDVLVHGEPERNDMVQYFAELLDGFAVTEHGWVQSYGSRCTRPSILWGDVARPAPMTVEWTRYAASLTDKPVKGMLTGPVTILAWSFVRDDLPLGEVADQVALALRDEVADLEAAGIGVIQVDEPALRELLPLRAEDHQDYLDWSVRSFRLATSGAAPHTQVHTHLCYSEFGEVIDAIDGLNADVTSLEAARSAMEVVPELAEAGFSRGIGPGVWDIHSPRVPSEQEIVDLLERAQRAVPAHQLWVNPDCGLKTRGYAETVESLRNLVAAAGRARAAG
ncbi:5-methyltetrahydropteroyltriglutamate--homocysteine S-methyltransferase [Ruania halotolerans]|uniref:5-methyltetrahydropteroyltriglutamate-- homocysteine S-methyltransferase n=1 Tax=Ruania halotolerans TaxID=2897773 RepID=UPI001E599DA3|nr:5-methyltetrahydropteroyltriglutamate--homocysteine S-methyltransferase [Ruania halotolerans]UFU06848.1 5-methyltetrahydropteroyltriglutamate--homocysteine S-methyltransferase [Ruania halotolerans]